MKTITTTLSLTAYVTRLEFWDLFRDTTRPTAEESNQPALLTYNEIMEYIYRRRLCGIDCGLPSLGQLKAGDAVTTVSEWTRGTRYFTCGFSGCNLYVADVRNPDGSLEPLRTDNYRAAFRLVVSKSVGWGETLHKENEYRASYQADRDRRR
jgi:hypothetical protein